MRRAATVVAMAVLLAAVATGCRRKPLASRAGGPLATSTTTAAAPAPAGSAGASRGPADCTPARPHAGGQSSVDIRSSGIDRNYLLYVPPSYDGRHAVPVMFNFHGFGSSALQQTLYTNFQPLADRDGVVIVAPNGQGRPAHFTVETTPPGEGDDVVFTNDILDQLEGQLCVDQRRVYSAGMSDGSAMTLVLACRDSKRFAAFGAVAALVYSPLCEGARSVPIAGFAGTADPIVPFDGGRVTCCGNPQIGSAPDAMAAWARHDGCGATPAEQAVSPMVTLRQWTGCRDGSAVEFYIVQGGGHSWPGAAIKVGLGTTTDEINATDIIWRFFQAHPLPA